MANNSSKLCFCGQNNNIIIPILEHISDLQSQRSFQNACFCLNKNRKASIEEIVAIKTKNPRKCIDSHLETDSK